MMSLYDSTACGSNDSMKLTEEQREYYKLMMEHMMLEMAAFEGSRRKHEDVEHNQCEDSEDESDYKSAAIEEDLMEMKQSSSEKETCNEEDD